MVRLFIFSLFIFYSSIAMSQNYNGVWEKTNERCHGLGWFNKIMQNDISVTGNTVTLGTHFGKLHKKFSGKRTIGINIENWGHFTAKLKNGKLYGKFQPTFDSDAWKKISKCDFIYAKKINIKKETDNNNLIAEKEKKENNLDKNIDLSSNDLSNQKTNKYNNLEKIELIKEYCEEKFSNAAYAKSRIRQCRKYGHLPTGFKSKKNLAKNQKQDKLIKSEPKNEIVIVNNNIEVNEDTIKPKIIVDNLFESNSSLMAIVEGSISDQSEIAVLTMDGYEIALNNNNFSKEFFVKPKGQEIEIVAIDIHGNKSSKIISLKRQKETIQQVKFDFLNPTKIQNKLNNNKAALIIGVESYENTFTALYAENDALYFNDYANTSLGVPKENIKLLVNNDAERNDTLKVISKWLPTVVKEDQTELFVYFSGHGLASEDGKDLYLLPTDGDPDLLELTALMRNQLFDQISSLNPKSVTVFLDTCYSGATRSDELLVASRPIFIEAEEQEVPTNFTIFSASAGKETAKVLKEAEHGLFSYFMMKGLEGDADSNNDRTITNGELHAFINKNVTRQANQTPQLNGDPNQVLVTW